MPVPTLISELSTTPGSNSPAGSDAPSVIDDHLRTAYSFIRTLSDEKAAITDTVLLTGNQTVAGTKTFSSAIAGSVTGTAANVTGTVAIANGGTGATTAASAFTALKQAATDTATGVVELATDAEAQTGTDATRAVTPDNLGATVLGMGQTWQNVTGSRAISTVYTNSTGRTIMVTVVVITSSGGVQLRVNGSVFIDYGQSSSGGVPCAVSAVVPPGATYELFTSGSILSIPNWAELR